MFAKQDADQTMFEMRQISGNVVDGPRLRRLRLGTITDGVESYITFMLI